MNKSSVFLSCLLLLLAACNPDKNTGYTTARFNEEAGKAAIMKTIEAETYFFYRRDYENWKKNFIRSDYAFQAWNNGDGTFDASTGWPAIDKRIGEYIKNNPVGPAGSSHPKVERKNIVVKFYSDSVAYLIWDQYNSDKEMRTYMYSKEERIMERKDSVWKIASVSAYWDYKNTIPADSIH